MSCKNTVIIGLLDDLLWNRYGFGMRLFFYKKKGKEIGLLPISSHFEKMYF